MSVDVDQIVDAIAKNNYLNNSKLDYIFQWCYYKIVKDSLLNRKCWGKNAKDLLIRGFITSFE